MHSGSNSILKVHFLGHPVLANSSPNFLVLWHLIGCSRQSLVMGPLLIDKVFELVFSHREVNQSDKVLLGLDHRDLLPLREGAGHIGLLGLAIVLEDGGKALPVGAHYS